MQADRDLLLSGMDKPQIVGLGLNGLIGQRIVELLSDSFEFINLSRSNGVDISDPASLTQIKKYKANFVLHLAAKTDVEACEDDKDLGEDGDAWKINVDGSQNVAEICRELGKKMIYISTDFVFDGEIEEGKHYFETDIPKPINWYAETKFEGEKRVEESGADYMITRIAYPYRAGFEGKLDFVRAIKNRLEEKLEVRAVTDHIFCPTFIDDIAYGIKKLIETDEKGIYHIVGSQELSPYEAATSIAKVFNLDSGLISKTTREDFFKDKAKRPFNLALSNDRIRSLGVNMKGFEEGLLNIKSQIQ